MIGPDLTLGALAVQAEAQSYVRSVLFKEGHVGTCALVHYGAAFDVVIANEGERVEDFVAFAVDDMHERSGYAVTLIREWSRELVTITVNYRGRLTDSAAMNLPRDLEVN